MKLKAEMNFKGRNELKNGYNNTDNSLAAKRDYKPIIN